MANTSATFGDLTAVTALGSTDLLPVQQGYGGPSSEGHIRNATLAQLAAFLSAYFLQPSNDLSDVPSPAVARANLGLGVVVTTISMSGGSLIVGYSNGTFLPLSVPLPVGSLIFSNPLQACLLAAAL